MIKKSKVFDKEILEKTQDMFFCSRSYRIKKNTSSLSE